MANLVIFDVDGTLCDTCDVDVECFWAVAVDVLGTPVEQPAWDEFPLVTDSGIAEALLRQYLGRAPNGHEVELFAARFLERLQTALTATPGRFRVIAGAARLLGHLHERGIPFGIATGGWSRSAKLKLRAAGLPTEHLLASADDSPHRSAIFRLADERARASVPSPWGEPSRTPTRTILIGDGTWDVKVAAELGWSFIGIGRGQRAAELRAAGASVVVPDYADLDRIVTAMSS